MDIVFLVGRILFGGFFIVMSANHLQRPEALVQYATSKKVPWPKFMVILSGLMILLGGLGIMFGINIKFSVSLISIFLIVVSLVMHNFWSVKDPAAKMLDMTHFLKNAAILGGNLMFLSLPEPWVYSIAALFR